MSIKWFDLYCDAMPDARMKAELMAMLWQYVLRCGDPNAAETLTMEGNNHGVSACCYLLDGRGLYPDAPVLEWTRQRLAGMPPPVPFMVMR